jgi:hypothetical protein
MIWNYDAAEGGLEQNRTIKIRKQASSFMNCHMVWPNFFKSGIHPFWLLNFFKKKSSWF